LQIHRSTTRRSDPDAPAIGTSATTSSAGASSLLSICIPTYNRSGSLDALLAQLALVKKQFGAEVEICVSDNHSSDDTPRVVDRWAEQIGILRNRNPVNIGFSGNVDVVVQMAKGKWLCLVGDDDLLVLDNLGPILAMLREASADTWILLPCLNPESPKSSWLSALKPGGYSALRMCATVWTRGVAEFGFIGCHVFSSNQRSLFRSLPLEFSQHWIHQNFWFLHLLSGGEFFVAGTPLVQINTSVRAAPYTSTRWATLWLQRLVNFGNVTVFFNKSRTILYITILREALAFSQFKEWVKFFLRHPKTCAGRIAVVRRRVIPRNSGPWVLQGLVRSLQCLYSLASRLPVRGRADVPHA
jgi:glycosyltransferase involved in cell wall biosynthesis